MKIILLATLILYFTPCLFAQKHNADYTFINDSTNEYSSIEAILELQEFRNKVVFIDIWGIGCKPCMDEMDYSKDLKNEFINEQIAYLYLCVRPTNKLSGEMNNALSQTWKEIVSHKELKGVNILMSKECYNEGFKLKHLDTYAKIDTSIMKGYIHFGIPLYLIANKEGKIVNYNAHRPSTGKLLYSQIQSILEE
jgi:thiol-disulfide isomerase/thioredoxin